MGPLENLLILHHCLLGVWSRRALPSFPEPMENKTVAVGRDVSFSCVVDDLEGYQVAWAHIDRKMVLSVHDSLLTRIPRFIVTHENYRTWTLQIKDVTVEDGGQYMCQVNTDPVLSQRAFLTVTVPPRIDDGKSTPSSVHAREFETVRLRCVATGFPEPNITWETPHHPSGRKTGSQLVVASATREDAGTYYCIASNGVPPAVSKRIVLEIIFPPRMRERSSVARFPSRGAAVMVCEVEASPKPSVRWLHEGREVEWSTRHEVSEGRERHVTTSTLLVRNVTRGDAGIYSCLAENEEGEARRDVLVHGDGAVRSSGASDLPRPFRALARALAGVLSCG